MCVYMRVSHPYLCMYIHGLFTSTLRPACLKFPSKGVELYPYIYINQLILIVNLQQSIDLFGIMKNQLIAFIGTENQLIFHN